MALFTKFEHLAFYRKSSFFYISKFFDLPPKYISLHFEQSFQTPFYTMIRIKHKHISFCISACCLATSAIAENRCLPTSIDSVFAPVKVAVQPSDAYIGLSLMDDGELRHYNYGEQAEPGSFYLSSRDNGITWTKINTPRDMPFADRKSPLTGEYIRLTNMGKQGVYCIRTDGGILGNRTITKVSDRASIMLKPPVFIRGGKRVVVAAHGDISPKGCYTYISDDDGRTWQCSNTVTSPDHKKGGYHLGTRWNHGAVEPSVVELSDGTLWMLMRTSQDFHYQAFSHDGCLTWSESSPSPFYGTITMPTIGRLADGRLLLLWCNTTPLPEREEANGVWDDVFTNRDAVHAAISEDDGKSWIGFRELRLNPMRNSSDYATAGGGIDRGMQQSQFVEVAPGKIIAAIGQHPLHRSILAFDVAWLYEKSRSDDFIEGLEHWSAFNYLKGIKGHCAYNRIEGCQTVAHSEHPGAKMLELVYSPNANLVADSRGAVWNYPALKKGKLTLNVKLPENSENTFLMLNDRWMNPCDTVAKHEAVFRLQLSRKLLKISDDKWHTITIEWNLTRENGEAAVFVDGKRRIKRIAQLHSSQHGLSYVHLLACPTAEPRPVYIDRIEVTEM